MCSSVLKGIWGEGTKSSYWKAPPAPMQYLISSTLFSIFLRQPRRSGCPFLQRFLSACQINGFRSGFPFLPLQRIHRCRLELHRVQKIRTQVAGLAVTCSKVQKLPSSWTAMPTGGNKGCENLCFYSDCPLVLLLLSLSFSVSPTSLTWHGRERAYCQFSLVKRRMEFVSSITIQYWGTGHGVTT